MSDPFDSINDAGKLRNVGGERDIDFQPLRFGKHKGKTPEVISDLDPKWLRWAYENVTNFPTCSAALYKDMGGKLSKAKAAARSTAEKPYRAPYENTNHAPAKPDKFGFDMDLDDDIPF